MLIAINDEDVIDYDNTSANDRNNDEAMLVIASLCSQELDTVKGILTSSGWLHYRSVINNYTNANN
jgi:hypothetical protein